MARSTAKNRSTMMRLVIFCLLLTGLVAGLVAYVLYQNQSAPPSAPEAHREKPTSAPSALESDSDPAAAHTVDYNRLANDAEYRQMMQSRKETFGIDASVDLIVKSDEDLRIGGTVTPMAEILEKIRLKQQNGLIEREIPTALTMQSAAENERAFQSRLKQLEAEAEVLLTRLSTPETAADIELYRPSMMEYRRLSNVAADYAQYQTLQSEITAQEALLKQDSQAIHAALSQQADAFRTQLAQAHSVLYRLLPELIPDPADKTQTHRMFDALASLESELLRLEKMLSNPSAATTSAAYQQALAQHARLMKALPISRQYRGVNRQSDDRLDILADGPTGVNERLAQKIDALRVQRDILEHELRIRTMPAAEAIYGIYVVQPGDNVWNIHFAFLTEYFRHKKVILTRRDDEPDESGKSSGVGRILKFSENMVSIYNLRERNLSLDLNLIHPLSKIVVFELGKAFSLLDQIDYANLSQIQFDGETLWLPARR